MEVADHPCHTGAGILTVCFVAKMCLFDTCKVNQIFSFCKISSVSHRPLHGRHLINHTNSMPDCSLTQTTIQCYMFFNIRKICKRFS